MEERKRREGEEKKKEGGIGSKKRRKEEEEKEKRGRGGRGRRKRKEEQEEGGGWCRVEVGIVQSVSQDEWRSGHWSKVIHYECAHRESILRSSELCKIHREKSILQNTACQCGV